LRKKFLRSQYLTGKPTQLRYLILLMISMLAPLIFVGGCLYYLIFTILAEQLGIPESIAYNLFPVIKKINLILAFGVPPLVLLLLGWGVLLSHRFVGPLERLEKEIDRVARSGDYTKRLRVRKKDDIRAVAEAVNRLLDRMKDDIK
jgi:methyl-accepting chemotaxis protein